ncbi:MAG: DUF1679 domain-containing protein [Acidimicrobiia bacterium]|nr:DUF1679 domain-containing protein [Acidimicrobiia bacterium]
MTNASVAVDRSGAGPTDEVTDLDPAWLSTALGVEVTAVQATRVGTGQMGQSWRLDLTSTDPAAPASLVAKMAGGDPSTRTLIADGYRNEFNWYTRWCATVDITTPRCWYATITEDSTSFVLLLDDLAPSAPGTQAAGFTVAEADVALVELAGLHGPRWSDPTLTDDPALRAPTPEGAAFHAQVLAGAIPQFTEKFAAWLSADDIAVLDDLGSWIGDWLSVGGDRLTFVHGDFRPDNLMVSPDGARIHTLDWQTLGLGFAGRDVGYFLGLGLDSDLRRSAERDLVRTYHEALVTHGVERSFEETFDDYRLGTPQGPLVTVLGAVYATATPTPESDAMFASMITRTCATIRDLDPASLLG